jgi:hypothetical protein
MGISRCAAGKSALIPASRHKPFLKHPDIPLLPPLRWVSEEVSIPAVDLNIKGIHDFARGDQISKQRGVSNRNTLPASRARLTFTSHE